MTAERARPAAWLRAVRAACLLALPLTAGCEGIAGELGLHPAEADGGASETHATDGGAQIDAGWREPPDAGPLVVDGGAPDGGGRRPAQLVDVYFSQAVTAPLVKGRTWVAPATRDVPLIRDRPVLLQLSFQAAAGDGLVRLEVEEVDGGRYSATASGRLGGPEALEALDAGIHFLLPDHVVTPTAAFSLSVEREGAVVDRFPAQGVQRLEPWPDRMPLRVMLVPIGNDVADPPNLDRPVAAWNGQTLRQVSERFIFNQYPVNDLEVRVHAPVHISGSDDGDAMDVLAQLRRDENLGNEWYYQGHLTQNLGGYSYIFSDDTQAVADRVGWVGYWPGADPVNVTHELGHNHGSEHTFSSDAYLPVAGRSYGGRLNYGYALVGGHLPDVDGDIGGRVFPPTIGADGRRLTNGQDRNFYDVMSYTFPYWVSPFTYTQWALRIRASNQWGAFGLASPQSVLVASRSLGGRTYWSEARLPLGRDLVQATLTSAEGLTWWTSAEVLRAGDGQVGSIRVPLPFVDWRVRRFEVRVGHDTYTHQPDAPH